MAVYFPAFEPSLPLNTLAPVLFLDRDGILNIDKNYLYKIEDFEWVEGIIELMAYMQAKGYRLVITTNQSGIGRGMYSEADFLLLSEWMVAELKQKHGIQLDAVYYCPHSPDTPCTCRKPNTGMFDAALAHFKVNVAASWMIGDKVSDIVAAQGVEVTQGLLVANGVDAGQFKFASSVKVVDSVALAYQYLQQKIG